MDAWPWSQLGLCFFTVPSKFSVITPVVTNDLELGYISSFSAYLVEPFVTSNTVYHHDGCCTSYDSLLITCARISKSGDGLREIINSFGVTKSDQNPTYWDHIRPTVRTNARPVSVLLPPCWSLLFGGGEGGWISFAASEQSSFSKHNGSDTVQQRTRRLRRYQPKRARIRYKPHGFLVAHPWY